MGQYKTPIFLGIISEKNRIVIANQMETLSKILLSSGHRLTAMPPPWWPQACWPACSNSVWPNWWLQVAWSSIPSVRRTIVDATSLSARYPRWWCLKSWPLNRAESGDTNSGKKCNDKSDEHRWRAGWESG